jgi:hypothetical protein
MNSEPVRLRSRVSARRGQGYFTPLAACSIKGGGGDAGIGDINSVAAKHLNDGGAGRFAINCCAGYGIILSSRTTAAQKDKKRGLASVQSLE